MRGYVENKSDRQEDNTKEIFESFKNFEKAIKDVFGTVYEERATEQRLQELRRGSASDYSARFRQITSKLEWEDEPLMAAFYQGLKDEGKDELYKEVRPDDLATYIAKAVRIDDRQYERCQKKKRQVLGNWKFHTSRHQPR